MPSSSPFFVAALSAVATATLLRLTTENVQASSDKDIPTREIRKQLGPWSPSASPYDIFLLNPQDPLRGPLIIVRLANEFCGLSQIHISRLPHGSAGTTSWSILLSNIHPSPILRPALSTIPTSTLPPLSTKLSWSTLPLTTLHPHASHLHIPISRATLMTLLALTNARPITHYSSAAGHRATYPSYCGLWSISWPLGGPCVIRLSPLDSHASAATDVYPPSLRMRVDKCVEMLAGIVSAATAADDDADDADGTGGWKLAFPGRARGRGGEGGWALRLKVKGFGGGHGSRHLYNMMGGDVFEVDMLIMVKTAKEDEDRLREKEKNILKLEVPCLAADSEVAVLFVPEHEAGLLAKAIDHLPWSSLSWSLHRGLRDVLLAYGTPVMDRYRGEMSKLLKNELKKNEAALVEKGWDAEFVHGPMADMAASAVLSGGGNSGDVVRVVVAIVEVLLEGSGFEEDVDRDRTAFWRGPAGRREANGGSGRVGRVKPGFTDGQMDLGEMDMAVALTKFFVLEWSQELNYQLYHDLPIELLLA